MLYKKMKINKSDLIYIGRYKTPLLYLYFVNNWVSHKESGKYGINANSFTDIWLDGHWFTSKKEWENIKKMTADAVKNKDTSFFQDFFSLAQDETDKLLKISNKINSQENISPEIFQELFDALTSFEFPWILSLPIGEALESNTIDLFNSISNEHLESFFIPSKQTMIKKQNEELSLIRNNLKDSDLLEKLKGLSAQQALILISLENPEIHQSIKNHVKEHKWIGMMHMWGSPYNEEKCIKQILNMKYISNTKSVDLELFENLLWIKQHTRDLVYWRNNFAETCSLVSYKILPLLEKASSKLGLNWDKAGWLSPDEFIDGLNGNNIPDIKIIQDRKNVYGLLYANKKNLILTCEKINELLNLLLETPKDEKIKGLSSYPGIVQGRVKIILSPSDISKVEDGDIIVSPETTPDFLPALSIAGAIVTDQGGMICHAAIVAREMKTPCVVGTKVATRLLKEGDLVEVDANKGIVRKIK
ncbi:MAG: PEP-utilizing enzyme [Candidatus Woesearchaeota archaeon]